MSQDARVVAGDYTNSAGKGRAFVWQANGDVTLLENPSQSGGIYVGGISADGSIVVGNRWVSGRSIAFRWSANTGIVDLPIPPATGNIFALCVSNSGVIGGKIIRAGAFRPWVMASDSSLVEVLPPPGAIAGAVNAITPDATAMAGTCMTATTVRVPTRWTLPVSGVAPVPDPRAIHPTALPVPVGDPSAQAVAISNDGSVIAGSTGDPLGAATWNIDGTWNFLASPDGFFCLKSAVAMSADGTVLAGQYQFEIGNSEIATWSDSGAVFPIRTFFNALGFNLRPHLVIALSGDGTSLLCVNWGDTAIEGWLLTGMPLPYSKRCAQDFNNDLFVDDRDYEQFVVGYSLTDCAELSMPKNCPADFDHDGLVTDLDFVSFALAYDEVVCFR